MLSLINIFVVYFICLSASFTTCSTGRSGCSFRICITTFCVGAGEKPSIVRALTASSFTRRQLPLLSRRGQGWSDQQSPAPQSYPSGPR